MQYFSSSIAGKSIKVVLLVLSGTMLASLAYSAQSKSAVKIVPILQKSNMQFILTVCPEGSPSCQFKKIQEAIDVAPEATNIPGGIPISKIQVSAGVYEENLIIRKSIIIEGSGRDKVFLRPAK